MAARRDARDPRTMGRGALAVAAALGLALAAGASAHAVVVGHGVGPDHEDGVRPVAAPRPLHLIVAHTTGGFTPDGDGHVDTWTPRFDAGEPLPDVELTVTDPHTGRSVRTLHGAAPDGHVRDLTWNGRNRKGALVGIGIYDWTLTALGLDGDELVGPDGHPDVHGTVEVDEPGAPADAADLQ